MPSPPPSMDEASELVQELQEKLATLDRKVSQYRSTLTQEFTKYTEQVLFQAPPHVVENVRRQIADSLKNYSSLHPNEDAVTAGIESRAATGTRSSVNGGASECFPISTPSRPRHDGGESSADEGPRSPHEREKEFQGLFTPTYLPLLEDSKAHHERRSTRSPPASPRLDKGKGGNMGGSQDDSEVTMTSMSFSSGAPRPPTPRRRNTDEVSVGSDYSDGPVRRSALRRYSSSSKGLSPRRVRFEVAGQEVLPTASPLLENSVLDEMTPGSFSGLGDTSDEADAEMVEDIELKPPPKRISSSQRLRELSRQPFEGGGTTWTTVSAPSDGSASVAIARLPCSEGSGESTPTAEEPMQSPIIGDSRDSNSSVAPSSGIDDEAEKFSDEDDEVLDMAPQRTKKSSSSNTAPSSLLGTDEPLPSSPRSSQTPASMTSQIVAVSEVRNDDAYEDELFRFDEDNEAGISPQSPIAAPQSPSPPIRRWSPSPKSPTAEENDSFNLSTYSSPQAQPIIPPQPSSSISQPNSSTTPMPGGIIGSFKGRPFSMPIVNEDIHAQAASWGHNMSFVGSVDGRTGMDASLTGSFGRGAGAARDFGSWRGSWRESWRGGDGGGGSGGGTWDGQPMSMSERLMMEEEMEAENDKDEKN